MNGFGYTLKEYEFFIGQQTNEKHLIVEGKTDQYFFELLLHQFSKTIYEDAIEHILIDDVDTMIEKNDELKSFVTGASCVRRKVEYIHKNVKDSPRYANLVFFADRDFDNFIISLDQKLQDELEEHKVDGSMIWSRGHSIENYLFDFNIIRQPLIMLSDMELFKDAIKIFEYNFYQTMKLATAMSIAVRECKKIEKLLRIIDDKLITLDNGNYISLKLDYLQKELCERGISLEESKQIIEIYQQWLNKIDKENVDINILKLICHGKIGIKFILGVYYSCINYVAALKNQKNQKAKKTRTEEIWQIANWWADKAARNECLYPVEVLEKLCLINNS
jgi:hypothetical protein